MNAKQKRFADEYIIDLNATQAAIRAGYSEKTAYTIGQKLTKKDEIQEYIRMRMEEKDNGLIASQDEVLKYLTAVMRNEKTEQVVAIEGIEKGISEARIIEKDVSIRDRNKAAELLAKRYGILSESLDVNLSVPVFGGEDELED